VDTIAADKRFHRGSAETNLETRDIGPISKKGIYLALQVRFACFFVFKCHWKLSCWTYNVYLHVLLFWVIERKQWQDYPTTSGSTFFFIEMIMYYLVCSIMHLLP